MNLISLAKAFPTEEHALAYWCKPFGPGVQPWLFNMVPNSMAENKPLTYKKLIEF